MTEAQWRRRFRAARVTLPSWARDDPERLLYASNAGGKWELYAWDRRADSHRPVTDRPEGTLAGALDPPGEWIWWFDDDMGNEFGRWMTEPFGGGAARPAAPDLEPAYSTGLALGRAFSIQGSSTSEGSSVHLLRAGETPIPLYDHREESEVAGLSRDEDLWCLSHSEHGDSRHPALRVLSLDGQGVAELWDGPSLGLYASGWSRVPGDHRLLVLHERRDLPRPMLWWPDTGDTRDLELDLPGEVGASWYPDGSAILLSHDHRGRVELLRLELETGRLDDLGIERGTISAARIRPDGEIWYSWSNAATPPEVRAGSSVLLRPAGEQAPPGRTVSDHEVGVVHVFVAEPEGERPYPTIFDIHGGPPSHNTDSFSPVLQAWVDHGFAVVQVNYRGSNGYGRTWRDALEGNPGLTELEDIGNVHDHVVASGIADPGRVILSGGSWGGYLTLLGLGTQPDRWSLGMAAVPVADYFAAYEDEMEPLKAFDRDLFGGTPEEIPEKYRKRSPMTYVDKVRVPVLILAGENDPRCPIRQIDNYIAKLVELDKPHEVYRYEAGHGSLLIEERIRQEEAMLAFASRYLGTPPPL
jgi:acetyl esterase/lipase